MNREVHVRICEGRGLRCPRLLGVVVSDEEKAPVRRRQVGIGKASESDSLMTCRNLATGIETGVSMRSRDESGGCPFIGQAVSGVEVA